MNIVISVNKHIPDDNLETLKFIEANILDRIYLALPFFSKQKTRRYFLEIAGKFCAIVSAMAEIGNVFVFPVRGTPTAPPKPSREAAEVSLHAARVILQAVRVILEAVRLILEAAKVILEAVRLILHAAKVILEAAKVVLRAAKTVMLCKIVYGSGRIGGNNLSRIDSFILPAYAAPPLMGHFPADRIRFVPAGRAPPIYAKSAARADCAF
ncbi:hypothetical protein [Treponema endosymbiont of Eucomonympha sp.]|uniref:hypothetical protein n=1 Tax=Treponema endosymbiont of Eucomonympha sp. TaxID=1580831 RepID=UPI0013969E83|nr:hypothetical protein [Treponema endosymbiont of Eucomonympha sp.]